jgi:hypothetical protein
MAKEEKAKGKTDKAKEPKAKKEKLPRYVVRLRDAAGNSLRWNARQREKGAISFAVHTVKNPEGSEKKATSTRGATTLHETFDQAKAAADAGAQASTTKGWLSRRGGGGGTKKDAFSLDSLPGPAPKPQPAPVPAPAA